MTDRYIVISADSHAGPRRRDYRRFLDPHVRPVFDGYIAEQEAHKDMQKNAMIDLFDSATAAIGMDALRGYASHPALQGGGARGNHDSAQRLRDYDSQGIAGEIILPDTQGNDPPFGALGGGVERGVGMSRASRLHDPVNVAAGCRAWNRWLVEFCGQSPARRAGVALIPVHDTEAAVAEIAWAREAGLRGGIYLPGQIAEFPGYHDPCYEPIWAACEEHDMTINVHIGNDLPDYGLQPESFILTQTEMGFFGRRIIWFFMWSGVFERYPRLRVSLIEQECYWVPQLLRELEDLYDAKFIGARLRKKLSLRPSEYWARHCFLGAAMMTRAEAEHRHEIGLGNIMWGADYPHVESTWPYSQLVLQDTFHSLPTDEVAAMVGGNAARVYGFDLAALQPVADAVGPLVSAVAEPLDPGAIPRDYIGEGFRRPRAHV